MSLTPTPDREIKIDPRTGIYHYRGTPVRGGKEITRSLGVRNFRTAVQAKREFLWQLRGVDPSATDLLFKDYVKNVFLLERKRRAPATYEMAYYCVQAMMPFFEVYTMRQINDRAWDEYVEYSRQMKPNRLLKYDRTHLLMMLHKLHKKGIVREIPELQLNEPGPKRRRVLTQDEIDAIFEHSEGTVYGLALFMRKMGCRPSEAIKAKWTEFNLERGIWNIPQEKGRIKPGKARSIKLNPTVQEWLRTRKKTSEFVFPSRLNSKKPVDRYNKQWDRMLAAAKLDPKITPYFLRHTFLTECAKKVRVGTVSLVEITTYAGTSIAEFERTYLHVEGEGTKAVATIMEGT